MNRDGWAATHQCWLEIMIDRRRSKKFYPSKEKTCIFAGCAYKSRTL